MRDRGRAVGERMNLSYDTGTDYLIISKSGSV